MSLIKETSIDQITIEDSGVIMYRETTTILDDGVQLSQTYHRSSISPGQDIEDQPQKIKDICSVAWTNEHIGLAQNEDMNTQQINSKIEKKIKELKKEGSRRIQTIEGRLYDDVSWLRKSQNYQDAIARLLPKSYYESLNEQESIKLKEAVSIINRKDRYVQRINELEEKIRSIDSIDDIDLTDDELWSGLDG